MSGENAARAVVEDGVFAHLELLVQSAAAWPDSDR
jgi:hypothetical protein